MHSVRTKGLQLTNQVFSRLIKVLVNRLQSFWSHRLDSDQRSFNIGPFHGHEELRIFRGFHRDLSKEIHVCGKLSESLHEFEALFTNRAQLRNSCVIVLPLGQFQIGKGDRIEIIVGKSYKSESSSP